MKKKPQTLWITRTAVLLALLIVLQAATAPLGGTFVTGSIVNLMLILSVMLGGLSCGITIAVLSPVLAKLLGIGPLWGLIPFIIAGNITIMIIWRFISQRINKSQFAAYTAAAITAAYAKFAVLYFGIVRFAIPMLLNLPEPQAAIISGMFSVQQLFTALAGGAAAVMLLPILKKIIKVP